MANPGPSIRRVQQLSGLEKGDAESVQEYIHRVFSTVDPASDEEQVVDLFVRAESADDSSFDGRELEALQKFYGQLHIDDNPVVFEESERSPQREASEQEETSVGGNPEKDSESEQRTSPPDTETSTRAESGQEPNSPRGSSVVPSKRRTLEWTPTRTKLPCRVRTALANRLSGWDFYDAVALVGLLVVGSRLYLHRLGKTPLANGDEGIYAAIASNMVEHGYWVVPHLNYRVLPVYFQPYMETPPLSMWLQASAMTVFGVNTFAARLPAAVATLVMACVIYVWGRQLFDRAGAFTAAFVFLTTPYVMHGANAGRAGTPAMVVLLFGTLFVYFVWRAVTTDESSVFVPMGVVAGGVLLTGGPEAAIFGLIALPLVVRNHSVFLGWDLAKGTIAAVVLLLPWVGVMHYTVPDRFVREAIIWPITGRGAGSRVTTGAVGSGISSPSFQQLLGFLDPWGYVLIPCVVVGLISHARHGREDDLRKTGFLTWYVAVVVLVDVFTGAQTWALLPAYVPATLLIGGSVTSFVDGHTEFGLALGGGIVGAALFSFRMGGVSPLSIEAPTGMDQLALGVEMALALGACAAILGGAHYLLNVKDVSRQETPCSSLLGVTLAVFLIGLPLGTPVTASAGGSPAHAHLGTDVDAATPDGTVLWVSNETARGQSLFAFSFHADVTMRNLGFETVQDLRNGTYAMVTAEERRTLEREHYVITRADLPGKGTVVVIRFG